MTKEEYEQERSHLQMVIAAAEQNGNHKQAAARRKKLTLLDNEWLLQNLTKRNAVTGDLPKELKVVSVETSETEVVPCDDPVKAFIDFFSYEQE